MSVRTLIAITTYQKTDALDCLLKSLEKYGYMEGNKVLICDDNAGQDYYITQKDNPNHPHWVELENTHHAAPYPNDEEKEQMADLELGRQKVQSPAKHIANMALFNPKFKEVEVISGKARGGVAINKNRGIKYFLEHPEFDELLMLDDDIVMTGPGLLEACRATGEPHMTGLLGGTEGAIFGADACPFFQSFPPKGETPTHWFCTGSMGMMLWYTRACVEKVGYFNAMPDKYGAEHSLYSCRINALYGKYIDWFPILKGCEGYFVSQSIPNNYTADYEKNMKYYNKIKPEIFKGINLTIKKSGC